MSDAPAPKGRYTLLAKDKRELAERLAVGFSTPEEEAEKLGWTLARLQKVLDRPGFQRRFMAPAQERIAQAGGRILARFAMESDRLTTRILERADEVAREEMMGGALGHKIDMEILQAGQPDLRKEAGFTDNRTQTVQVIQVLQDVGTKVGGFTDWIGEQKKTYDFDAFLAEGNEGLEVPSAASVSASEAEHDALVHEMDQDPESFTP